MNRLKKLLACVLACVCCLPIFACNPNGPGEEEEKIDPNRTQLYVANFNGGYGKNWINALKASFEAKYKDVVFEEGKTGVQVMVSNSKTNAQTWLSEMDSSQNEVFFTEWMYLGDHLSQNKLLDITDIVTESLNESTAIENVTGAKENLGAENEGSIEDKLNDQQKSYYSRNGRYYALPHYQAYTSIMYDIDLFEENKLYFALDRNNGNDGFIIRDSDVKSYGPDGKTGNIGGVDYSEDDGLPATFEEFYKLCKYMKDERGVVPLAWTGANQVYVSEFINLLMANYCGADEFMLNYTMNGSSGTLLADDGVSAWDPTPQPIDSSNAYLLSRQKGKLDAFKFIEGIIRGEYYDVSHSFAGVSHLQMQDDFLWSRFNSKQDIAMIIEGNWWENEAAGTWENMANVPGARKTERKLGVMPLPWPTASDVGNKTPTYLDSLYSACFIKASIDKNKIPLAKLFLQYTSTNEALATFTVESGQARSFKYTLTDEQYDGLTHFQKQCWNIHKNANWVYPYSNNEVYNYSPSNFSTSYFNRSTYMGISQNMSHVAFKNNNAITAFDYWKGNVELNSKSAWESSYKSIYEK